MRPRLVHNLIVAQGALMHYLLHSGARRAVLGLGASGPAPSDRKSPLTCVSGFGDDG